MNKLLAFALLACCSLPAFAGGDAESGEKKSAVCAACHGKDGNTPASPDFPRLAGQYEDYLLRTLTDYKTGARKNPIMAGQVTNLSAQDLADLAAYFSGLKGPLHTIR